MDYSDADSEATLTGDEGVGWDEGGVHSPAEARSEPNSDAKSLTEEVYQHRRQDLFMQLDLLRQRKHPKYLERERALKEELDKRLLENDLERIRQLELAERECEREFREAEEQFEQGKIALQQRLEAEVLKQRELCYQEFLHGKLMTVATPFRSNIATRPKDNKPEPGKGSTPRLVYQLKPEEIEEDLQAISVREPTPTRNTSEEVVVVDASESSMAFNGHSFRIGDCITIIALQMNPISGTITRLSQKNLQFKQDNQENEQCFPLSDFRHGGVRIVPREEW